MSVNTSYLINTDTKEAIVIDGGESAESVLSTAKQNGFAVKYMLLTHAHFDHASCAKKLQDAGAFAIVLELVSTESAEYITNNIQIPTIGIGAGIGCSGQIVVTDDIMGKFTDFVPKFVKKYANLHDIMHDGVQKYLKEVKSLEFPSKKESFELNESEKIKLFK